MINTSVKFVTINNAALAETLNVAVGDAVSVECRDGVPVVREWRNRFKDAVVDGCITVSKPKSPKESKS